MAVRLLVVSPVPSHPQDQGNSARILALGQALRQAGIIVHFLYVRMEGMQPAQHAAMQAAWDYFHTIPYAPADMRPSLGYTYGLDDWYDSGVTQIAADLHRRWHFAAVLTNYVWFSRVLTALPSNVLKILDTHDVFGGRDKRFRDMGLEPEWFHTTAAEEWRGVQRADIVLAIQSDEAAYFRGLGHPDVRVIGHAPACRTRPIAAHQGDIVAGYLASGNPLNRRSLAEVASALPENGVKGVRCVVAGSICDAMATPPAPFVKLGRVPTLEAFYANVDVVINPMSFGTGLKIKSVEAVFQGLPLIATKVAMAGLPVLHPMHDQDGPRDVADCLARTRFDAAWLNELAAASGACARTYRASVRQGLFDLGNAIIVAGDDDSITAAAEAATTLG